jgi:cobalt-zinc-cadmium efflux system outer membrane protein
MFKCLWLVTSRCVAPRTGVTTSSRREKTYFNVSISSICALAVTLLLGDPALATEAALTRQRIAALVKTSPAARIARSEEAASRAAVTAAEVLSFDNPTLSALGGARFNPGGERTFNGVASLSWPIDVGGKRGARIDAAEAELTAALASTRSAEQNQLLAAFLLHAEVLHDRQQLEIARERHELSDRLLRAAQRRRAAGNVSEIDVALAAMQVQRDASTEASIQGTQASHQIELATLLGLGEGPNVAGALVPTEEVPTLSALLAENENRADVRAAAAALEAANAKASRERSARMPTVNVLAQYERDDQANIGLLGLSMPIPVLNANRTDVLSSRAEVAVAKARLLDVRAKASGQTKKLHARFMATKASMDTLIPNADLAARTVDLATRAYELGENDLASVLLVRREAIEAQAALLEAEHAHAAIKIELMILAERLPQ